MKLPKLCHSLKHDSIVTCNATCLLTQKGIIKLGSQMDPPPTEWHLFWINFNSHCHSIKRVISLTPEELWSLLIDNLSTTLHKLAFVLGFWEGRPQLYFVEGGLPSSYALNCSKDVYLNWCASLTNFSPLTHNWTKMWWW